MHQTFSGKAKTFTLIVLFVFLFLYLSCSRSQRVTIRLAGDEWFLDSLTTTGMIGVFEQQSGIHVKVLHKNDRAISAFLASVPVAREKSTIPESGQMTGASGATHFRNCQPPEYTARRTRQSRARSATHSRQQGAALLPGQTDTIRFHCMWPRSGCSRAIAAHLKHSGYRDPADFPALH
jgi:hypothetical protein